ncbi:MAG: response regulator [Magnetospiraceae bacterium]
MNRTPRYLEQFSLLVVEPNPFMRSVMKAVLKAFGARDIKEAPDGSAALGLLQTNKIDILFSEKEMQPLDGVEMTRVIRTAKDVRDNMVPIVMVSAYSELYNVLEARDAGITEFVRKPFSATDLFSRINEVIERPRIFVKSPRYTGPDRRRRVRPDEVDVERRAQVEVVDSDELSQDQVNELIAPSGRPA